MNRKKQICTLAIAAALASGTMTGCKQEEKSKNGGETELSMLYNRGAGITVTDEDEVYKKIEEATGVKLTLVSPPMAEYSEKINILMAANETPDIIRFDSLNNMRNYAIQGALKELDDLFEKAPHIKENVDKKVFKYTAINGKVYAIPMTKSEGKYNVYIREDWLKNLGMDVPETLDEYTEVLRAFKNNDPDGNGKADTVGFSAYEFTVESSLLAPFFGAFGVMPGGYYYDEKNDEIIPYEIHPNTKKALEYLHSIYKEGLINADFLAVKRQQSEQNIENGSAGMSYGWWNYGINREKTLRQLYPDASLIPIAPPTGPDGMKGNLSAGAIGNNCYTITTYAKNPEKAIEFLDYFYTVDGMMLSVWGIEGKNYKWNNGKSTPSTINELNSQVDDFEIIDKYNGDLNIFEPQNCLPLAGSDGKSKEAILTADGQPVIKDYGQGLTCDEIVKYRAALDSITEETFVKIIIGDLPLEAYDEYVKRWREDGGNQVIKGMTREYKRMKEGE